MLTGWSIDCLVYSLLIVNWLTLLVFYHRLCLLILMPSYSTKINLVTCIVYSVYSMSPRLLLNDIFVCDVPIAKYCPSFILEDDAIEMFIDISDSLLLQVFVIPNRLSNLMLLAMIDIVSCDQFVECYRLSAELAVTCPMPINLSCDALCNWVHQMVGMFECMAAAILDQQHVGQSIWFIQRKILSHQLPICIDK